MSLSLGPEILGHAALPGRGEDRLLSRITWSPDIFDGRPTIRGHRVPVLDVLSFLAAGGSPLVILQAYRGLEMDDIRACLVYARRVIASGRLDQAVS